MRLKSKLAADRGRVVTLRIDEGSANGVSSGTYLRYSIDNYVPFSFINPSFAGDEL